MQNKNMTLPKEQGPTRYEVAIQRAPEQLLDQLSHDERITDLLQDIEEARVDAGQIKPSDRDYVPGDTLGMQRAMSNVFSFRKQGGERNEYEEMPQVELFRGRIEALAHEYGFTNDTVPENPNATAGVVLGGRATGSYDRTRYTKELIDNGYLDTDTIVLLGSTRPADSIDRKAGEIFDDAVDEYDIMKIAAKDVFGVEFDDTEDLQGFDGSVATGFEQGWRIAHAKTTDGKDVFVLSAPQLTDNFHHNNRRRDRANTGDTLNMFAKVARYEQGSHAVVITNAHFKPFQGAEAVGNLDRYGVTAETVGFEPEHFDRPSKAPEELMEEMFTAVNSSVRAEKGAHDHVKKSLAREVANKNNYKDSIELGELTDDPDIAIDEYNLEIYEHNKRIQALESRLAKIALLNK